MNIEYYAFALFLAGLVCLIAIICKALFGNVRRQRKLLDEKEAKLLQLYQAVEGIMEEFGDQVRAAAEEIGEYKNRTAFIAASLASLPPEPPKEEPMKIERLLQAEIIDSIRLKAANEALSRAEKIVKGDAQKSREIPAKGDSGTVFQRFFDETMMQPPPPTATDMPAKHMRSEAILTLAGEGKTDAQIASELGITQNEVRLIIDLLGGKNV